MSFTERLISAGITGAIVGGVVGQFQGSKDKAFFQPQIMALQNQIQDHVDAGIDGGYKCDKPPVPGNPQTVFPAKKVAGDAALRQVLHFNKDNGTCTVTLNP